MKYKLFISDYDGTLGIAPANDIDAETLTAINKFIDKGGIFVVCSGRETASIMRIFLFLAVLGIVSQGLVLDPDNPAASVFQYAAGDIGYKIFGVIMWAAAVTSVIGAAYTSVSFIKTFSLLVERNQKWFTIGFIIISTVVFATVGEPVKVLVLVGALNGLILPIALCVMLIASYKKRIVGDYNYIY